MRTTTRTTTRTTASGQAAQAARTTERVKQEAIRLAQEGLDAPTLRAEAVALIERAIPTAATCCLTTDPATVLLTGGNVHTFRPEAIPALVSNEYLQDDFIKFRDLATLRQPVSTLHIATRGNPTRSRRFREVLEPYGLGNELRVVFRSGGAAWGAMCLHREAGNQDFTDADVACIAAIAPHLAAGLRRAVLLDTAENEPAARAPGLLLLADDLTVLSATPAAELLLAEISANGYWPRGDALPVPVCTAAAKLQALGRETQSGACEIPCVRLRTRAGRWLALHASRMSQAADQIAIIIEQATPNDVAPYVLRAYVLTAREQEVATLVLKGLSTEDISVRLCISTLTVQQHLKAIFEKVGVRSRRELVARIYARSFWPAMASEYGLSPTAWSPA